MGIVSGIVVYICIWWVVIFCVLPMGVTRSDVGPEEGLAGAPQEPKIKQKFIATTLISAVVWIAVYVLIDLQLFDFRSMAERMLEAYN